MVVMAVVIILLTVIIQGMDLIISHPIILQVQTDMVEVGEMDIGLINIMVTGDIITMVVIIMDMVIFMEEIIIIPTAMVITMEVMAIVIIMVITDTTIDIQIMAEEVIVITTDVKVKNKNPEGSRDFYF